MPPQGPFSGAIETGFVQQGVCLIEKMRRGVLVPNEEGVIGLVHQPGNHALVGLTVALLHRIDILRVQRAIVFVIVLRIEDLRDDAQELDLSVRVAGELFSDPPRARLKKLRCRHRSPWLVRRHARIGRREHADEEVFGCRFTASLALRA